MPRGGYQMKYKSNMVKVKYHGLQVWVDEDTRYLTTNENGAVHAHYSDYPRICEIEDEWSSEVMTHYPVLEVDLEDNDWTETFVDVRHQIKAAIELKNTANEGCQAGKYNAEFYPTDGVIFNDTATHGNHPFPDGTPVRISAVRSLDGDIITTASGTRYKILKGLPKR